ncbi:MAG: hypothetical protein KatS3mg059_1212 [Thermomicrobiales bacterium]|nr:MAG: hypothetical protein KatS3mg059_1212 [Thermomicrobiales bacterium]
MHATPASRRRSRFCDRRVLLKAAAAFSAMAASRPASRLPDAAAQTAPEIARRQMDRGRIT